MSEFLVSTERHRLDLKMIHQYLAEESYWAQGISMATVQLSIENSICLGGFLKDQNIAFARAVTDKATFAYLKDVFVLPEYRGRGFGIKMVESLLSHPDLQSVSNIMLGTEDAFSLYEKFGFTRCHEGSTHMQRKLN